MSRIKACPFCGGVAKMRIMSTDAVAMLPTVEFHRIRCIDCGATLERLTVEQVIKDWNKRTEADNEHIQ